MRPSWLHILPCRFLPNPSVFVNKVELEIVQTFPPFKHFVEIDLSSKQDQDTVVKQERVSVPGGRGILIFNNFGLLLIQIQLN